MNNHSIFRLVLLCAGVLASATGHAGLFTLEQAIEHALAHNPVLAARKSGVEAAAARREVARGAHHPELGLSLSAISTDNALEVFGSKLNTRRVTAGDFDPARLNDPSRQDIYHAQLALRVPVYRGGQLAARSNAAEENASAHQRHYERTRELVIFQTHQAYRQVQLAEQAVTIAAEAAGAARGHARTTAALARAGRTVVSDRLTAEVYQSAMESQHEQNITRLEQARSALRLTLGLTDGTTVETAPLPAAVPDTPLPALAELETAAIAARTDLAAAQAQARASGAELSGARAAHRPRFDVIAARNHFDDREATASSTTVMGVLSIDLYSGRRHSAGIDAATADAQAAQWQVRALEQAIRHEVRAAHAALQGAIRRHALSQGNVERARDNVRLVRDRYGQGRTILIDLLQAERALVEARLEELTARVQVLLGWAELDLAAGKGAPAAGVANP